ncbi:hypothetical protein FXO38_35789 [Capsicum annuum]|nr:hypothetical protein FXO38_35789 [Capsicum annuum]KAF3626859.1 hypothetical protein FXO37_30184 [Capsicum annuum]
MSEDRSFNRDDSPLWRYRQSHRVVPLVETWNFSAMHHNRARPLEIDYWEIKLTGETTRKVKVVADIHQRKEEMSRHSDAFIALPTQDGKLSVKELQPVIADIGVALGLRTQGSYPESDHIYFEVLQEFAHRKQDKVSKTEFKEVFSDNLLGMVAGLKRDPILLLCMDGEDLLEFIKSPTFELEMLSLYFELELPDRSLKDYIIKTFEKLTIDQGKPPASDSWVMSNVVEPVVESYIAASNEQPIT